MQKVCANCKNEYIKGDKYCRFCGAPMGTPVYITENFAEIYGPPPVKRTHTCKDCGHLWQTTEMIDNQRWCPECGGKAPVTDEEDFFGVRKSDSHAELKRSSKDLLIDG